MTRIYHSKTIVEPGCSGWIVRWMSNQLTQAFPQWPRLRVEAGQQVTVSIDPSGSGFGLHCDTDPTKVQVCAVIEPDEQPEGKRVDYLLPFPPFSHALPWLAISGASEPWISTRAQMPELDRAVLVWCERSPRYQEGICIGRRVRSITPGLTTVWELEEGQERCEDEDEAAEFVTFWMPLPEPPTKGTGT